MCIESKAFSKSMKFKYNVDCHSLLSSMFCGVHLFSAVLLPFLNPVSSFLDFMSTGLTNSAGDNSSLGFAHYW